MFEHPSNSVLSAYHDGELSPVVADGLAHHLRACGKCYMEYQTLARTVNGVRHLRTLRAPASLAARVREQIDTEDRGMVPVLRGQVLKGLKAKSPVGFFSALGMGTLTTVLMIGLVVLADYRYGEQAARQLTSAWIQSTLPEPVLLHETMSSPRVRGGSLGSLPFSNVEQGQEGTVLTLASIDRNGMVQGLEVIYRSGDEEMLARALDTVRRSGFEPAKLGDETISVNFLYLFTRTEVRPDGRSLTTGRSARYRERA